MCPDEVEVIITRDRLMVLKVVCPAFEVVVVSAHAPGYWNSSNGANE